MISYRPKTSSSGERSARQAEAQDRHNAGLRMFA
jgi:hypothetical protein